MITYAAFTLSVTSWRTRFRKEMNEADNRAATKVVDALTNFEAVKVYF
jgi:ABC transporter ATM